MTPSLLATASGLGLGLALIVAIGAQNAFVLRQGLRGEHVPAVVAVCAASDVVLIAAGVAGAGALLDRAPGAVDVVRWAGAAFLLAYAGLARDGTTCVTAAGGGQAAYPSALHPASYVTVEGGLRVPELAPWSAARYLDNSVVLVDVVPRRAGAPATMRLSAVDTAGRVVDRVTLVR